MDASESKASEIAAIQRDLARVVEDRRNYYGRVDEDAHGSQIEARTSLSEAASFAAAISGAKSGQTIDFRRVDIDYGQFDEDEREYDELGRAESRYNSTVAQMKPFIDRLASAGVNVQTEFRTIDWHEARQNVAGDDQRSLNHYLDRQEAAETRAGSMTEKELREEINRLLPAPASQRVGLPQLFEEENALQQQIAAAKETLADDSHNHVQISQQIGKWYEEHPFRSALDRMGLWKSDELRGLQVEKQRLSEVILAQESVYVDLHEEQSFLESKIAAHVVMAADDYEDAHREVAAELSAFQQALTRKQQEQLTPQRERDALTVDEGRTIEL